jgi:2'-5' RNA ligase
MDLQNHYANLHKSALAIINKEGFSQDNEIDNPNDLRRGLTLLLRPNVRIRQAFDTFIQKVKQVDPDQYFYPPSDIHVTLMPVISCYSGFSMEKLDLVKYDRYIQNALKGVGNIGLRFEGVFASPACLIIKGYPLNEQLDRLRQQLRDVFSRSDVEQSLDKRYKLVTAHSSVVRFRKPTKVPDRILELLALFESYDFGQQYFDEVELVYNDWYQRQSLVKTIYTYPLSM